MKDISYDGSKRMMSREDYLAALNHAIHNRIMRSLIWNFARCLPAPLAQEAEEIRRKTFFKEFWASQTVFSDVQLMDYGLLTNTFVPFYTAPDIKMACRMVAYNFYQKLKMMGILFPNVQRTKNVSQETAALASAYIDKDISAITTSDLEEIYHRTGIQVQGGCEVRSAWRFNDLKPRVYYCQGGRDYFGSRYMKRIAVALMECIPTTARRLRTNPERYLEHEFDRDYVVTWDFESFTTQLSELKYFMDEIVTALEAFPEIELSCFDSYQGVIKVNPVDLLAKYNEIVNIESPFSIHRMIHRYSEDIDPTVEYHQRNSGCLGVTGNIGFSTAWHGFAILETVGPEKGVSVGDDGMAVLRNPQDILGPLSEVAKLHPEKSTIVEPMEEDPFRFLKRAFYRQPDGSFFRDQLFNLPLIAMITEIISERDIIRKDEEDFFMKRVITQASAFLWDVQQAEPPLTDEELKLSQVYLKLAYNHFQLPISGCLPGFRQTDRKSGKAVINMAVPSLQFDIFDPRIGDWLEFLLYNSLQMHFSVPVMSYKSTMPLPIKGDIVYDTKGVGWSFLEDFGYAKKDPMFELKSYLEEADRDRFRRMIKRSNFLSDLVPLYEIQILKDIPEIFDFMFTFHYESHLWEVDF
jgi:hypothetical protein